MTDVYQLCPIFESEAYLLRLVQVKDGPDLLKVYSDPSAVPLFNSDNCGGDDFYYTTLARMEQAIHYWLWEYERAGFVRWTILSKRRQEAVGTIELFHREAADFFTNCGLLRLDLRSDYETEREIAAILELILTPSYSLFCCDKLATKAPAQAPERQKALERLGFHPTDEALAGHDGTLYDSYWVREMA